jgi:hypothetical protein
MKPFGHIGQRERLRRDRSRRVILLIVGIVVLSLADLLVTLWHLTSRGMAESNPIAAWIITDTGSASLLTAYKLLTVAVCTGLLYRLRSHVQGEVGAWCAVMILAAVSFHWGNYTRQVNDMGNFELARQEAYDDAWLMLD